ncbi:MAG: putative quinol monooxygenase [Acidobacteriota bacterium]
MTPDVFVIAQLRAFEHRAQDAAAILNRLAEATRKEPGCAAYHVVRDPAHPAHFRSIEQWRSAQAEAAHWDTDHLKRALADLEGLLEAEAVVHKYTSIEQGG